MAFILTALVFYTASILLGAVANRAANTTVVTVIINTVSAVVPIGVMLSEWGKRGVANTRMGLWAAVLAGLAIAAFSLALNKSFVVNKVAIVAPIVFGGSIFLSALLSYVFFRERISLVQGVGLALLGLGLALIIYAKASGR